MKIQLGSFLLTAVMIFSGLAVGVSGSEKVNTVNNAVEYNIVSAGNLLLPSNNREWCYVSTDGGNLNVRNSRGAVVTKLANGTAIWVGECDADMWCPVSINRRGRLVFLGWAAGEYISC